MQVMHGLSWNPHIPTQDQEVLWSLHLRTARNTGVDPQVRLEGSIPVPQSVTTPPLPYKVQTPASLGPTNTHRGSWEGRRV